MILQFESMQNKLVLEGLITQIVLPFDEQTQRLVQGQYCKIMFEDLILKGHCAFIEKVSMVKLKNLTVDDIFKCGFLYKQFFYDFMHKKGLGLQDTVVKIDFKLIKEGDMV